MINSEKLQGGHPPWMALCPRSRQAYTMQVQLLPRTDPDFTKVSECPIGGSLGMGGAGGHFK